MIGLACPWGRRLTGPAQAQPALDWSRCCRAGRPLRYTSLPTGAAGTSWSSRPGGSWCRPRIRQRPPLPGHPGPRSWTEGSGPSGAAFHPDYAVNRGFFVDYTRRPDGAIVIAESRPRAGNPDVASDTRRAPPPRPSPGRTTTAGSMSSAPTGSCTSAWVTAAGVTTPRTGAQDPNDLPPFGKILKDRRRPREERPASTAAPLRTIASSAVDGGAEIFAFGLRNPYRVFVRPADRGVVRRGRRADRREEVEHRHPPGELRVAARRGHPVHRAGPGVLLSAGAAAAGHRVRPRRRPLRRHRRLRLPGSGAGPWLPGPTSSPTSARGRSSALADGRLTVLLGDRPGHQLLGEDADGELYVCDLAGGRVLSAGHHRAGRRPGPPSRSTTWCCGPGDPVRVSARLENAGPPTPVDVYVGALLEGAGRQPDPAFRRLDPPGHRGPAWGTGPRSLCRFPLVLDGSSTSSFPDVASFTFTGGELPEGGGSGCSWPSAGRGRGSRFWPRHLVGVDVER